MTSAIEPEAQGLTKKQRSNALLGAILFIPVLIVGLVLGSTAFLLLGLPTTTSAILGAFVGEALAILAVFAIRRDSVTTLKSSLSMRKASVKTISLAVAIGVALYVALLLVSNLLPAEEGYVSDTSAEVFGANGFELIFLLFLSVPFLAPLFEELALRGAFRNSFAAAFKNTKWAEYGAIGVSAILFSLMHFQGLETLTDLVPLIISLVLGLISGALAYRSLSIWPSVALHCSYNLTTVLVVLGATALA